MTTKYRGISGPEFEKLKVKLWTIHCIAIVRLYSSVKRNWQFQAKGWLILSERKDGVLVFTLVGIRDHDNVLWRHELYEGFDSGFEKLSNVFLSFQGEKYVFGMSFSEAFDATRFWEKVSECVKDSFRGSKKRKK